MRKMNLNGSSESQKNSYFSNPDKKHNFISTSFPLRNQFNTGINSALEEAAKNTSFYNILDKMPFASNTIYFGVLGFIFPTSNAFNSSPLVTNLSRLDSVVKDVGKYDKNSRNLCRLLKDFEENESKERPQIFYEDYSLSLCTTEVFLVFSGLGQLASNIIDELVNAVGVECELNLYISHPVYFNHTHLFPSIYDNRPKFYLNEATDTVLINEDVENHAYPNSLSDAIEADAYVNRLMKVTYEETCVELARVFLKLKTESRKDLEEVRDTIAKDPKKAYLLSVIDNQLIKASEDLIVLNKLSDCMCDLFTCSMLLGGICEFKNLQMPYSIWWYITSAKICLLNCLDDTITENSVLKMIAYVRFIRDILTPESDLPDFIPHID